jgi:hypothetical protein
MAAGLKHLMLKWRKRWSERWRVLHASGEEAKRQYDISVQRSAE